MNNKCEKCGNSLPSIKALSPDNRRLVDHPYTAPGQGPVEVAELVHFSPTIQQQSKRFTVLISARSSAAQADRRHFSGIPDRHLTLFAPEDSVGNTEALFDALSVTGSGSAASGLRGARVVLGASLKRLDPVVRNALLALGELPEPTRLGDISGGLARWIESYARGDISAKIPRRTLSYALYSASLRSRILSHIVRRRIVENQQVRLVDHGASIGLLMLCASHQLPPQQLSVFCTEIDQSAIEAGREIWSYCGLSEAIIYQPVSAVDFSHPGDIDVAFFGQMLFRIPREARADLFRRAWRALRPGGCIVINEIMNRTNAVASSNLLTSDELLAYLPTEADVKVYLDFDNPQPILPEKVAAEAFTSSENCIVAIKPSVTTAISPSVPAVPESIEPSSWALTSEDNRATSVVNKPDFNVTMIVPKVLRYDDIIANATGTDLAYLEGRSNMEGVTERFIDYIGAKRTDLLMGNGSLLDSGCGNGRFCEAFARRYDVTGEDLSPGGIYRALEGARERGLNIRYRLADSLAIDDMFDVVFLRGPSYLVGVPALSEKFAAALAHMIRRARRELIFVSYSTAPFGVQNRSANWMHDPEHVALAFASHGGANISYRDNYIVATWRALEPKNGAAWPPAVAGDAGNGREAISS